MVVMIELRRLVVRLNVTGRLLSLVFRLTLRVMREALPMGMDLVFSTRFLS